MRFKPITDAVGNNMKNNLEDVQTIKRNLARLDLLEEEDHGYITQKMDDGIKTFQKENGLKVDGRLYPGGETERTMYEKLSNNSADDHFGAQDEDYGTVGFGGNISGTLKKQTTPKPARKPESTLVGKPVEYDVTGRMIIPEKKPSILINADDNEVASFIEKQERSVQHLYKDNTGFLTIGVGHRVTSSDEAKKLPLYLHDEENNPVRRATSAEIERAYQQAHSIKHGQNISYDEYDPKTNPNTLNIRLRKEDESALLKHDLHVRTQELRRNWPGFNDYPGKLQMAMLDVHFNTGNLTPKKWPRLYRAIRNKDKVGIVREIHRNTEHKERNKKIQDMLMKMEITK